MLVLQRLSASFHHRPKAPAACEGSLELRSRNLIRKEAWPPPIACVSFGLMESTTSGAARSLLTKKVYDNLNVAQYPRLVSSMYRSQVIASEVTRAERRDNRPVTDELSGPRKRVYPSHNTGGVT